MSVRTTVRDASDLIVSRTPFAAGGNAYGSANFRGDDSQVNYGVGRLNDVHASNYRNAHYSGLILFTVYSYGTPIAWFDADRGWYVVDQRFSSSTSRHQSTVRRAVA